MCRSSWNTFAKTRPLLYLAARDWNYSDLERVLRRNTGLPARQHEPPFPDRCHQYDDYTRNKERGHRGIEPIVHRHARSRFGVDHAGRERPALRGGDEQPRVRQKAERGIGGEYLLISRGE